MKLGTDRSHYFKLLKPFHRFSILSRFGIEQTKRKTRFDESGKMVINHQNNPVITFYVALKVVKCNVSAGNKSNNILLDMTSP